MDKTITLKIEGDAKGVDKAVDSAIKSLNRLQRAKAQLSGGKTSTSEFTQFNNLSKAQLAEVQRVAKERQKFAQQSALQEQRLTTQSAQKFQQTELAKQKLVARTVETQQKLQQKAEQFEIKTNQNAVKIAQQSEIAKQKLAQQTYFQKQKLAQQAGQFEIRNAQAVEKAQEAARRRDLADFQKIEKEKARIAATQARSRISAEKVGGGLQSGGQGLQSVGVGLTASLTAPIVALATLGVKFNAMKEQALISFGVLLKSGEKAKDLFGELNKFAADTPFELPELLTATKSLLAFGVAQSKVVPTLKQIGDIASGVGAPVGELAELYGKAKVQGRLFAEDVNQLTGRGIPVIQEFAKQFGVTDDKVKGLVEDGKIGFPQLEKAFASLTAEGGLFFGMTEAQSKSFTGLLSTLGDNINNALGDLTAGIFAKLTEILPQLIAAVGQLSSAFAALSPGTQAAVIGFAAMLAAAGPILIALGSLVVAIGAVITAFGTISAALAAAGITFSGAIIIIGAITAILATVGAAAYALYEGWQTNFGNIQGVVSVFVSDVSAAFAGLLQIIQPAIDSVTNYVIEGFNNIKVWWAENGAEINQAATKTFATLLSSVKILLEAISDFWATYGETIKETVSNVWGNIKTIISSVMSIIGNVIKLGAQIINNDWSGAWETFKQIVVSAFDALVASIKATGNLIAGAVKLAFEATWALHEWLYEQASSLGENVGKGLYNGLLKWIDPIGSAARSLGKMATDAIGWGAKVESPSKATIAIGEFIGEGLALGIENKIERVKKVAKKIADETIKQLAEATKAFNKLAGASPEQVGRIQQTNKLSEATSAQQEIIKLRGELGVNNYKPLPSSVGETDAELKLLRWKTEEADKFAKSLENISRLSQESRDVTKQDIEEFETYKKSLEQSGAANVLNLQEEFDLLGVVDVAEQNRIKATYEILRLRQEMQNDGYGEAQIAEAEAIAKNAAAAALEWQRLNDIKRQGVEASNLAKDLDSQLETLRRNGAELSEYEKVQRQINENYKDLSAAEKQDLLNKAAQIDAQKQLNEQYNQTYDFIRDSLDVLTDSSKSIGERLKDFFGGIVQSLKKMFLDAAASFLTSKLFQLLNPNAGGSSSGGGLLGGISGIIKNFIGGRGGSSSGSGGIFNLIGGGGASGGVGATSAHGSSAGPGGGGFGLSGGMAIGGIAAQMLGSAIGGIGGQTLSMAGQGLSIGMMFGGPLGGAIGAGIGAVVGLVGGLIGRNKLRKAEEKQRTQFLLDAFEGLKGFDSLIAEMKKMPENPDDLLKQGEQLGSSVRDQYLQAANGLKDKKTRNIAIADVSRVNSVISQRMAELNELATAARQASGTRKRLGVAEFATGTFLDNSFRNQYDDFKRMNGMLQGHWTGRDELPALLAKGEMVLNPAQQHRVKIASGFDPFEHAQIPGYASGIYVAPSVSAAPVTGNASPVVVKVYVNNSGIVESDIQVEVDKVMNPEVVVELYEKGKSRNLGNPNATRIFKG